MKKVSVGLGTMLCGVVAVLATGWWVYIGWFDSEASYLVRSESLFGALLWWFIFLFSIGGFPSMVESKKDTDRTEDIKQPEENVTL